MAARKNANSRTQKLTLATLHLAAILFFPNSSHAQTVDQNAINQQDWMTVKPHCDERFWIDWYGAYEIDPKNLAIWICVKTDKTKLKLASDTQLKTRLNHLFIKYDYPIQARSLIQVGFESQETVNRESHGNWYHHFK